MSLNAPVFSQNSYPCGAKVVHGTCGFSDEGAPWNRSGRTAADRLRSYSRHYGFGCVEVDTTTYSLKSPGTMEDWAAATPPDFTFHVKIFGFFPARGGSLRSLPRDLRGQIPSTTSSSSSQIPSRPPQSPSRTTLRARSSPKPRYVKLSELPAPLVSELWRRFNAMLQPLVAAGKMGAVLVQFHTSFAPSTEAEEHVRWVRSRLRRDVSMAVEFRNRAWLERSMIDTDGKGISTLARTCALLSEIGAVLVASDDLLHEVQQTDRNQRGLPSGSARVRLAPVLVADKGCSFPKVDTFGFCRVHRRHGTDRLLKPEELKDWIEKIQHWSRQRAHEARGRGPLFFLWGTDHADQAVQNRRALDRLLPETLRFDWNKHVKESETKQPHTLRGMFARAAAKMAKKKIVEEKTQDQDNAMGMIGEKRARVQMAGLTGVHMPGKRQKKLKGIISYFFKAS